MRTCVECGNEHVQECSIEVEVTMGDHTFGGWVMGWCCTYCKTIDFTQNGDRRATKLAIAEKAIELVNELGLFRGEQDGAPKMMVLQITSFKVLNVRIVHPSA